MALANPFAWAWWPLPAMPLGRAQVIIIVGCVVLGLAHRELHFGKPAPPGTAGSEVEDGQEALWVGGRRRGRSRDGRDEAGPPKRAWLPAGLKGSGKGRKEL